MTQITIVQNLPEQQWRSFVDQHPDSNIFHTPEMYEVFSHAHNHEPELWAAVSGDRILALLLPVRIHTLTRFLRRLTTRAIAYGGVLYAQDQDGPDGMEKLLQAYKQSMRKSTLFIELRNMADLSAMQPTLGNCHYAFVDYLNYLVDTDLPVDQVWKNISKSAKKNITKALNKNQFEILEAQELSQVEICYGILKTTYTNAHIPLADYSLFEAAFITLQPKSMVKFFLGRVKGQNVAASVLLIYKDVIYGWYRGFDRAYASYLPNDLMVWNTLKWAAENHFRIFDFGGAGKPDEIYGPRQFKAKFGGKEVNYGRNICVYSPSLLRISKYGYEFFRHLPQ
ncbi:MAG TPA: GNAT family N-acetyltransferase [Anaerolineales bacterium]|nr:GNAT family N-acetyltransferase [Anaerolineales bacterium]